MKRNKNRDDMPGRHAGLPKSRDSSDEKHNITGYPDYPDNEDIYRKYKEEKELDPENTSETKSSVNSHGANEKGFENDVSGSDLDVPGAELDNDQESIGNEDEENNYYSLGDDDHDDLEEDKGD